MKTCWVILDGTKARTNPHYWTGQKWSSTPSEALRLAREVDAKALGTHQLNGVPYHVEMRMWD